MNFKVKINKIENENKVKAFANVTFDDCFVVTGIRIIDGEKGEFVSMPNRKNKSGEYNDICFPVTAEFRQELFDKILDEYKKS